MKKNYFIISWCMSAMALTASEGAMEREIDTLYTDFYTEPLSGEGAFTVEKDGIVDVMLPQLFSEKPQTPEALLEQANLEMFDVVLSHKRNLPVFLIAREGIEAAQTYEEAAQAFLDKDETQKAIELYKHALEIYEHTRKLTRVPKEMREIKHAIRSVKYVIKELEYPKNNKKKNVKE